MLNQQIGPYKIISELGEGGMAVVYLAEKGVLRKQVALKMLHEDFLSNRNIRGRFLSEARKMINLNHPNIVGVQDLIDDGDFVAIELEYIDGKTLKQHLHEKGALPNDEIERLFKQMLDAVGYIHEKGYIHRDIKPSNFMLTQSGIIKLTDFGIAKNADDANVDYTGTGTGMQMGTPKYMSPEQVRSTKDVDHRSDIYSLGVVLWEMVTGKVPYDIETESTFDVFRKIVDEPLEPTDTRWDKVIEKCTNKNIEYRYQKVDKLKIDLKRNLVSVQTNFNKSEQIENNKRNYGVNLKVIIFGLAGLVVVTFLIYDKFSKNKKEEQYFVEKISKLEGSWMLDEIVGDSMFNATDIVCEPEMLSFSEDNTMIHKVFGNKFKSEKYKLEIKSGKVNIRKDKYYFLKDVSFNTKENSLTITGKRYGHEIEFYLSNRGIYPEVQSNKKLNISDYRNRMEKARMLIDDDGEYCKSIENMIQNKVNLIGYKADIYMNGHDISLLSVLQESEKKNLSRELAKQILKDTNREFYAITYASNNHNAIEWLTGFTHPYLDLQLIYQKLEEETSEIKKAELMKDYALKWHEFSWGRLQSGSGMSYSDTGVEYIYFDSELEKDAKEKLLLEIAQTINGSGKGNAYYCLFLLYEETSQYRYKALNYLKKSISIFENLPYKRHHSQMLSLGISKLKSFEE